MIDVNVEKVMDRNKVANAIHASLDEGVNLLKLDKYGPTEHAKMKLLRTPVSMILFPKSGICSQTRRWRTQSRRGDFNAAARNIAGK